MNPVLGPCACNTYSNMDELLSIAIELCNSFSKSRILRFNYQKVSRWRSTSLYFISGSDKFRIETYYFLNDKLVAELQEQSEAYDHLTQLFYFLLHLLVIDR